jgi:integrase
MENPGKRARLKPSRGVYWATLGPGRHLGYRKGRRRGAWIAKLMADGQRREIRLGLADDAPLRADGRQVLTFAQVQARAWEWFTECLTPGAASGTRRHYTVNQACADYVAYLRRNGKKSASFIPGMFRRHVRTSLGMLRVDELTTRAVEQWRDRVARSPRRGARAGPSTPDAVRKRRASANLMLWLVKAALTLARRDHSTTGVRADGSAWKAVAAYRGVRQPRLRFLSPEEQRELVNACEADMERLVRAALYTGARFSELAAAKVLDFNPSAKTLLIAESKSGKPRHIRLEPEASRFFKSLQKNAVEQKRERLLFPALGDHWTGSTARAALRAAWKQVAAHRLRAKNLEPVRPCTFHELRHTAASRWVAAGMPLKFVSAQLGHGLTAITELYYVHLAPENVEEAFARLPAPKLGGKRS